MIQISITHIKKMHFSIVYLMKNVNCVVSMVGNSLKQITQIRRFVVSITIDGKQI